MDARASSPRRHLPKCLHEKLPIGISTAKQRHREEILGLWAKQWRASKRYTHLSHIDLSAPSKRFIKIVNHLPKSQTGILYQLRSGHVTLNKHLHRLNCSDSWSLPHPIKEFISFSSYCCTALLTSSVSIRPYSGRWVRVRLEN